MSSSSPSIRNAGFSPYHVRAVGSNPYCKGEASYRFAYSIAIAECVGRFLKARAIVNNSLVIGRHL